MSHSISDLVEVDAINIGGMLVYVSSIIWLPATAYEVITWIIGTMVGVSLIALNIIKIKQYIGDDKHARRKRKKIDEE